MTDVKRNKKMAKTVLNHIKAFPEYHDQGEWFRLDNGLGPSTAENVDKVVVDDNVCNTSMCVAGTVMYYNYGPFGLSLFDKAEEVAAEEAARLLGIDDAEAQYLFYEVDNDDAVTVLKNIARKEKNIFVDTEFEEEF